MNPLSALRATPAVPAGGAPGRRPGSGRRKPAPDPTGEAPFGQIVADVAANLAGLSAANRAARDARGNPADPGPPTAMGSEEQPAEAAVIAALCDAERRGSAQGGGR